MYKNNSRNSTKFRDFSSLQVCSKLKNSSSVIDYYSYTHRCTPFEKNIHHSVKHSDFSQLSIEI